MYLQNKVNASSHDVTREVHYLRETNSCLQKCIWRLFLAANPVWRPRVPVETPEMSAVHPKVKCASSCLRNSHSVR